MEKEILDKLKALTKDAKQQLAEVRRLKRESRLQQSHSSLMQEFLRARESGVDELYLLNKFLDRDDLSVAERHSLRARRRKLLKKTTPKS